MNIQDANKIVIKVGSALIADKDIGTIKAKWLENLALDIAALNKENKQVVIVSSGAVALGRKHIKNSKKSLKLEEKQAAAACGQIELMQHYNNSFNNLGLKAAQLLLTVYDSDNRRNYLNAKNTLVTLLENNIIPIINENDTVATQELRFGDNDRLAARVAQMIEADLLIILSDIDGLYDSNPQINNNAKHIDLVSKITNEIKAMAGDSISNVGTGGMTTKIEAAKIAVNSGCNVIITKGTIDRPLTILQNNGKHTLFTATETALNARKRWLYNSLNVNGIVVLDDGAYKALLLGKSLLPAGVKEITGEFERGDVVIIKNNNIEIGRGLIAYSSTEAQLIKGKQSANIENILGFSGREELIHRDNMVIKNDI